MCATNTDDEFAAAWASLPANVDEVYVFSHCNGMSLIFQDGVGISATGLNKDGDKIMAISSLAHENVGSMGSLYLVTCNAGHVDLYEKGEDGTNAAWAFVNLGVPKVVAYDGNMSFGSSEGQYEARKSWNQKGFAAAYGDFNIKRGYAQWYRKVGRYTYGWVTYTKDGWSWGKN